MCDPRSVPQTRRLSREWDGGRRVVSRAGRSSRKALHRSRRCLRLRVRSPHDHFVSANGVMHEIAALRIALRLAAGDQRGGAYADHPPISIRAARGPCRLRARHSRRAAARAGRERGARAHPCRRAERGARHRDAPSTPRPRRTFRGRHSACRRRRRGRRCGHRRHAVQARRPRGRHLHAALDRRRPHRGRVRILARRQCGRNAVRDDRLERREPSRDSEPLDLGRSGNVANGGGYRVGRAVQVRRPCRGRLRAPRRNRRRFDLRLVVRGGRGREADHHELERREARACRQARRGRHRQLPDESGLAAARS